MTPRSEKVLAPITCQMHMRAFVNENLTIAPQECICHRSETPLRWVHGRA